MKLEIFDSRNLPSPADRAVAQALASRSLKPFGEHLTNINSNKTTSFYERNIIGFGHDNLNSCADGIIISLPEISMLAAKYVEDSPLWNGQESSTRCIDFSNQPVKAQTNEGVKLNKATMVLFNDLYAKELMLNINKFKPADEIAQKSVKAYTLDVMRCLLPVGLQTNVNWVTNLRQVQEHCRYLMSSSIEEVRLIGDTLFNELEKVYSGLINKVNWASIEHMSEYKEEYHYFSEDPVYTGQSVYDEYDPLLQKLDITYVEEDLDNIRQYESLKSRPKGCPPPRIYSSQFELAGLMDFGSFRDLQRHRNGMCKIPPVNIYNGFEDWYLRQMSGDTRNAVESHLNYIEDYFGILLDPYIVPLGYRVPFVYQAGFEQLIYISELRSSKSVHPTCRSVALCIANFIKTKLPEVALYVDDTPLDHFNVNRGKNDIKMAEEQTK